MINDSSILEKGQRLKIELNLVKKRLPKRLLEKLISNSYGTLIGFKMVDGNQFGLVLEIEDGSRLWFFEEELSEVNDIEEER